MHGLHQPGVNQGGGSGGDDDEAGVGDDDRYTVYTSWRLTQPPDWGRGQDTTKN